jgi:hypothetical protein
VDAQSWHDYCTLETVREPPALTVRQWKKLTDQKQKEHLGLLRPWLEHFYIQTDELGKIANAVTRTVQRNAETPPGAKRVFALTGPNLIGKSTLIMRWARGQYTEWTATADRDQRGRPVFYPTDDSEADLCPVAWIQLPAQANINSVNTKILDFYGLPGEGRTRDLTARALHAAQRHLTRVLIFDDVHLLYTDWKGGRFVLDHLKHINTELGQSGATLVLIGADLGGSDLINDPQIAGRLTLHEVPKYEIDSIEERKIWQRIVRQLESRVLPHLSTGEPGMLFMQLPGELWLRTQGYLGDLTDLVGQATIAAIEDGTHRIHRRHLDAVELSVRAEKDRREKEASQRRSQGSRAKTAAQFSSLNEDTAGVSQPSP